MGNSFPIITRPKRKNSEVEGEGVGYVRDEEIEQELELDLDEGRVFFCNLKHGYNSQETSHILTLIGKVYRSKGRYFGESNDLNIVFDVSDNEVNPMLVKDYMKGQPVSGFQQHLWGFEAFAQYSKNCNSINETRIEDTGRVATVTYRANTSHSTDIKFPLSCTQFFVPDLPDIASGTGIELIQNIFKGQDPITQCPTHVNAIWHIRDAEITNTDFDPYSKRGVILPAYSARYYLSRLDISFPYHSVTKWILSQLRGTMTPPKPHCLPSAPPFIQPSSSEDRQLRYPELQRTLKRQKLTLEPAFPESQYGQPHHNSFLFPKQEETTPKYHSNIIRFDVPFKLEPKYE